MRPFRSLSARLTVQFALLFAGAMLVVSAALSTFIAGSASREVESQLQSSGAVYDRLWQQRAHELQNAAQLLARDFGFRAAVATGDEATMQSALGNAAARLRSAPPSSSPPTAASRRSIPRSASNEAARLWEPLDEGRLTGVSVLAGRPRQLVAAPIMAPTLIGWVVFAADLDDREMRSLERLSAIPLHAAVLAKATARWSEAAGSMSALDPASFRCARPEPCAEQRGVRNARRRRRRRSRSPSRCRPFRRWSGRSCCSLIPRPKRLPTRASCSSRSPS